MSLCAIKFEEIFPTKWSLFIFLAYMMLFVNQGILVRSSQSADNSYSYNVSSVVLFGELLKLVICLFLYLKENTSLRALFADIRAGWHVCLLYLIPAALYCLYNNLAFINLANYDPTSYFILLQLRNVITGALYQLIFHKKLTRLQWLSLVILTLGCIVKELGRNSSPGSSSSSSVDSSLLSVHLLLILLQVFCSCFAGVYNEYLLKDTGASVNILIQNIFMYVDSILCNLILVFLTTSGSQLDFSFITQPILQVILINGALAGITTSFFLKSLNSILKTFAATLEIIITAILCYFIFSTPIDIFTVCSIFLIFFAILLYSQAPVKTSTAPNGSSSSSINTDLLKEADAESIKVLISK